MTTYRNFEYLRAKYPELTEREWSEAWLERLHRTGLLRAHQTDGREHYEFCESDLRCLLDFLPRKPIGSSKCDSTNHQTRVSTPKHQNQ